MGAGNFFPGDREHYTLFYLDLDSGYLSPAEFRQAQASEPDLAEVGYEDYLQDAYRDELGSALSVGRSLAKYLVRQGFDAVPLHEGDRTRYEKQAWLTPLLEVGLVRVACKEVEISRLAVMVFPTDEVGLEGNLDELSHRQFLDWHGITRQHFITASLAQMSVLDVLLLAYYEAECSLICAGLASRRAGAWCSSRVPSVPTLPLAARAFRTAWRLGQPRRRRAVA